MNVEQATVERSVFVAEHPWRRRGVWAAGAVVAMLLAAWLVAIVVGALGFGSLPALPLVPNDESPSNAAPATSQPAPPGGSKARPVDSDTATLSTGAPDKSNSAGAGAAGGT